MDSKIRKRSQGIIAWPENERLRERLLRRGPHALTAQDQKAYQDKLAGAVFIEFLRKRLILIRELLSDNGSLVIHLDARKGHYLKVILDEVFTENNFRNEIIVKRRITKNLQQQF